MRRLLNRSGVHSCCRHSRTSWATTARNTALPTQLKSLSQHSLNSPGLWKIDCRWKSTKFGEKVDLKEMEIPVTIKTGSSRSNNSDSSSSSKQSSSEKSSNNTSNSNSNNNSSSEGRNNGSTNDDGFKRIEVKLVNKDFRSWDAFWDIVKMMLGVGLMTGIWRPMFLMDTDEMDNAMKNWKNDPQLKRKFEETGNEPFDLSFSESLLYTLSHTAWWVLVGCSVTRLLFSIPKSDYVVGWLMIGITLHVWNRFIRSDYDPSNPRYLTLFETGQGQSLLGNDDEESALEIARRRRRRSEARAKARSSRSDRSRHRRSDDRYYYEDEYEDDDEYEYYYEDDYYDDDDYDDYYYEDDWDDEGYYDDESSMKKQKKKTSQMEKPVSNAATNTSSDSLSESRMFAERKRRRREQKKQEELHHRIHEQKVAKLKSEAKKKREESD